MKKFLLTTLLVLVTVVAAFAQNELTATYTTKGTSYDVKKDILFKDASGNQVASFLYTSGGSAPRLDAAHLRIYQKNVFTLTMAENYYVKAVTFTCTSASYAFPSGSEWTDGTTTASYGTVSDNKTVKYVWTAPLNATGAKMKIPDSSAQVRFTEITITYTKAGATFEEINQTYSKDNATLQLKYSPEDLFTGITPIYDVTNANGCIDENLNILKAGTGTLKVTWSGSASSFAEGNADVKFTINKAQSGLSYSKATAEAFKAENEADNDLSDLPTLANPNGIAVKYSSLDPGVATIDADGKVKLMGIGETLITASPAEDNLYEGEAEYVLNVQTAGLPSMPTFSFENDSYHKINETLVITPATEGDKIYYKIGEEAFKLYESPISFTAEEVYTVTAYAKNDKGDSAPAQISFTIELLEYAFNFKEAESELVLGKAREFEIKVDGAVINDLVISREDPNGVLYPIPQQPNKFYIVAAGDVQFKATAKENADYYRESTIPTKTYTVKPQMVDGGSAPVEQAFDFVNYTTLGFDEVERPTGNVYKYINLDSDPLVQGDVSISFNKVSGSEKPRINIGEKLTYLGIYRDTNGNKSGNSFTISANEITQVDITFSSSSGYAAAMNADGGQFASAVSNVRTWTPEAGVESVSSITFQNVTTAKENVRIEKIIVHYTGETKVAKEFKPYELTLAGSDYEIGEALPQVVLPEGCTAPVTYLVNDEEEPAYATKHFSETSVKIVAHTPGFGDYLPSVSEAFNITPLPINLPNQLTIHYSQGDGINMEGFKTVAGENGVYVFENIPVIGYDARVADKNYGHVFFSFYNVESTPAAAPRRAAAETDWSEVNKVVTYTPAEHRTVSGLNDEIELVRNKANTISGLPNVLCVPSAHETGKDVTFTVELKDDGTPSKVKLAEGTQTGVESVGVDADGEAEYYTLQGVRVAKPAAGIYLRRQGGTVSKVLVK